jgi:serine/threonine protein kinase
MSDDSTKFDAGLQPEAAGPPKVSPPPKVGDVLAGKYRIERVLGEGGMGMVVSATHLQLRQTVALKFMLPRVMGNKEAVARFEREARAAVRLKSAHVAKVLDTGTLENGAPFMVMEYLEGDNLASLVRGPEAVGLPIELAVDYVLQALEGLAEAHALEIVHRDLKPANLFLTSAADGSPTVKVLDFGVSKVGALAASTGDETGESDVTRTQGVVGSPLYMSPEQMKSSRDVDSRTDIWSMGVCLFELLTAKVPFEAESIHQQYAMLMLADPPKPSAHRGDIPPALDDVVTKCLAREREDRFADVGELAKALEPFAPEHSRASVARIVRTIGGGRKSSPTVPRPQSLPPPPNAKTDVTWGGTTGKRAAVSTAPPAPNRTWIAIVAVGVAIVAAIVFVSRNQATPVVAPVATATVPPAVSAAIVVPSASTPAPTPTTPEPSASAAPVDASVPKLPVLKTHKPPVGAPANTDEVDFSHRK